jgi:hypothetical protein
MVTILVMDMAAIPEDIRVTDTMVDIIGGFGHPVQKQRTH